MISCPLKPDKHTSISFEHTKKGSVHWFDLEDNVDPKIGSEKARPYMIINESTFYKNRVIISPITDKKHCLEANSDKLKYPCNAPLSKKNYPFLDKDSVVLLDQVYTISKSELCEEWYMGQVDNFRNIDEAIMYNYNVFDTTFVIYKELFEQLGGQAKEAYMKKFSRV